MKNEIIARRFETSLVSFSGLKIKNLSILMMEHD